MNIRDTNFSIIEERNCPLYARDDFFSVTGLSLVGPEGKPTCLLLVKELAKILLAAQQDKDIKHALQDEYNCPGCTGIIKFGPTGGKKSTHMTSQMQMMIAAELKEQASQSDSMYEILSSFQLFKGMEKEHLRKISERLQAKTFTTNQHIVFRGKPGSFLYIITSGSVDVLDEKGGVLTTLHEGETFGEMSLFSGKPISATIRANNAVHALLLSSKDLSNILIKYPFLQMVFTRMLVRRLSTANTTKTDLGETGVTGKIEEISLAELFQMFNTNSRTGIFKMQLPKGAADMTFVEGQVTRAKYGTLKGTEAFWAILAEQQGSFMFTSYVSINDITGEPLGSFMGLLMEGMRRFDEASATPEQLAEK